MWLRRPDGRRGHFEGCSIIKNCKNKPIKCRKVNNFLSSPSYLSPLLFGGVGQREVRSEHPDEPESDLNSGFCAAGPSASRLWERKNKPTLCREMLEFLKCTAPFPSHPAVTAVARSDREIRAGHLHAWRE